MENNIQIIEDFITLPSKRDVLRLYLYTKLLENQIKATDTEIEVLMELYDFGGVYEGIDQEKAFFDLCIKKNHRRSYASVGNVLSKFVLNGVLLKPKKHHRQLNDMYLPRISTNVVGLNYKIINNIAPN